MDTVIVVYISHLLASYNISDVVMIIASIEVRSVGITNWNEICNVIVVIFSSCHTLAVLWNLYSVSQFIISFQRSQFGGGSDVMSLSYMYSINFVSFHLYISAKRTSTHRHIDLTVLHFC